MPGDTSQTKAAEEEEGSLTVPGALKIPATEDDNTKVSLSHRTTKTTFRSALLVIFPAATHWHFTEGFASQDS